MMKRIKKFVLLHLLSFSFFRHWNIAIYRRLGMNIAEKARIYNDLTVVGLHSNISLKENAEVTSGCFLLAKEKIEIGVNSTLAYQVTLLTSANPNGPNNLLSNIYPKMAAPIIIGDNCWIGARALILPGITVGECSVVAAGAVVTKDVPAFSVVAGVPARVVKQLDPEQLYGST